MMRQFWLGATSPSLAVVLVACGVCIATFCSIILIITPNFMASKGDQLFVSKSTDYDLFSTIAVLRLKTDDVIDAKKLILLGGSTTRAAFLENDLAMALSSMGKKDYEVIKLCTARQMLWDSLTLIDKIPSETKGIIILGITPGVFTTGKEKIQVEVDKPRLGLHSDILEEFWINHDIKPLSYPINIYAIDNHRFLLGRLTSVRKNLFASSHPKHLDSRFAGKTVLPRDEYFEQAKMVNERLRKYPIHVDFNLQVLQKITRVVRRKTNMTLVFVEAPINPQFVLEFNLEELLLQHENQMRLFTERHGIRYINTNELTELKSQHFYDWAHLNDKQVIEELSHELILNLDSLPDESDHSKLRT